MDIRVAIVGASGYAGAELCAILVRHPHVKIVSVSSGIGGRTIPWTDLHPSLAGTSGIDATPFDFERILDASPDVVFLVTPNESSATIVPRFVAAEIRVIDLSGAYRLLDAAAYSRYYGFDHPAPELLDSAVYGLAEHCNGDLVGARLVANPGCYATSIILALTPILDLLAPGQAIVCDAKSGVSGAGKRSELDFSFTELAGNFKAYSVAGHRHTPEIRQALGLNGAPDLVFVPHLLPIPRGILSTIYVAFGSPQTRESVARRFADAYATTPFVRFLDHRLPDLRCVVGTPRCEIGFELIDDGRRAVVVSTLDNLLKGAASQAVQNFNRAHQLDEREGLS